MALEYSKEFALLLERFRFNRGMSQEEFTDGIISNRQYQRYVKGESLMPFHLLNDFAAKLGIEKDILIYEFEKWKLVENKKIHSFYQAVISKDFNKVEILMKDLEPNFIIESQNLLLYNLSLNHYNFFTGKITLISFINHLNKLIDYPKILDKTTITQYEALVLTTLLSYVKPSDGKLIADKINCYVSNPSLVITSSTINLFSNLYFSLAKYYGQNEDFVEALRFSDMGINYCLTYRSNISLNRFYYFKALCHYELNQISLFEESLFKCYSILVATNEYTLESSFVKMIEEDFNICFKDFAIKYIKENT